MMCEKTVQEANWIGNEEFLDKNAIQFGLSICQSVPSQVAGSAACWRRKILSRGRSTKGRNSMVDPSTFAGSGFVVFWPQQEQVNRRSGKASEKYTGERAIPTVDLINFLPDECVYHIFASLPNSRDRCACAFVCRRWLLLQSHMPPSEFRNGMSRVDHPSNAVVATETCWREGRGHAFVDGLIGLKLERGTSATQPQLAAGDLSRCLEGRKATDVRLASIAIGTAACGGLGKLSVKGYYGASRNGALEGITDVGLSAIGVCCGALRSLSLWKCPNVGDEGLAAVGNGCHLLEKFQLLECAGVSDSGIRVIAKGCPHLISVSIELCENVGDYGLQSVGEYCMGLLSFSISYCRVGTEGVKTVVSNCRKLKRMKLDSIDVDDEGLALIGQQCKVLASLKLNNLKSITEAGFICLGNLSSSLQELRRLFICACPGISDLALESIGRGCQSLRILSLSNCNGISDVGLQGFIKAFPHLEQPLRILSLRNCKGITDVGLQAFTKAATNLQSLQVEGCNRVTHVGLRASLANREGLKILGFSKYNRVQDKSLASFDYLLTCNALQSLYLTQCLGVGSRFSGVAGHSCPALEHLNLHGFTKVNDHGLSSLLHRIGRNLSGLNLSGCGKVSDRGICIVAQQCQNRLKLIALDGCTKVTDLSIKVLAQNCPALEDVDLSMCGITDEGVMAVVSSSGDVLKSLSLQGCRLLTDRCLSVIQKRCRSLWALNVKHCRGMTHEALDALESQLWNCDVLR